MSAERGAAPSQEALLQHGALKGHYLHWSQMFGVI